MSPPTPLEAWEQRVAALWKDWWIQLAALLSLLLQLLLLLSGGSRKWSRWLAVIAWTAYNAADYVATLVLGGMAQASVDGGRMVYAVWAPILLLHLGAPDNISAYAMEDAELWLRHGLTMLMQVAIAIFVVVNGSIASERIWVLLAVALLMAGSLKYAERTLALRASSNSSIVAAVHPLYKYMRLEPFLDELPSRAPPPEPPDDGNEAPRYLYVIQGEQEWYRRVGDGDDVRSFVDAAKATPSLVTLQDILQSRASPAADPLLATAPSRLLHLCLAFALFKLYRRRICRLYMYEWRQLKTRQIFLFSDTLTSSFFGESASPERDILFVLDAELRFLYDSLYTKAAGTAFTKGGVALRVLTAILLTLSATVLLPLLDKDLRRQSSEVKLARPVTFFLVAAAIVIEVYQILRLLLSDWSTVWLVCAHIQFQESLRRQGAAAGGSTYTYNWLRRCVLRNALGLHCKYKPVLRQMYWRNRIGQYSFLDSYNSNRRRRTTLLRQNDVRHANIDLGLMDSFQRGTIRDVLQLCSRLLETHQAAGGQLDCLSAYFAIQNVQMRGRPRTQGDEFQRYCRYIASSRNGSDLETLIVSWHVSTLVCVVLDRLTEEELVMAQLPNSSVTASGEEEKTLIMWRSYSKLMSGYAMYLLVNKAELLPCHADIGRRVARRGETTLLTFLDDNVRRIRSAMTNSSNTGWDVCTLIHRLIMESETLRIPIEDEYVNRNLFPNINEGALSRLREMEEGYYANADGSAAGAPPLMDVPPSSPVADGLLAGKLLMLGMSERGERWKFVWGMWVEILCCMACANKAKEHLDELTKGGELLTHVWLLLGHLGFGDQG